MPRLMAVPLAALLFQLAAGTALAQQTQDGAPAPAQATVGAELAPESPDAASSGGGAQPAATAQPAAAASAQLGTDGVTAGVEAQTGVAPTAAESAAPAATTTAAVGVEGQTVTSAEQVDAGTYGVRLRDLEQRINELKEQIFRSKARLSLLAETVLQGVVAGAQARLIHVNKMGSSYELVRVVYALDGAPIFNKADESGELSEREEFDVYDGSIVPGEHTLTVTLQYRGHGYGIFSYLKGYRFNVSSTHTFTAAEGKVTNVRVVGFEKGGPTAPLEERPAVRFIENLADTAAEGEGEGGE